MIVWVDTETTGLDEQRGDILEVALVVTDDDLNEVAATSTLVTPLHRWIMDDVVRKMHTENKLLEEVTKPGVPRRYEAEALLVEWLKNVFKDVPDVATHECANCGKNESEHFMKDSALIRDIASPDVFVPKMISALSQIPLAGSTVAFDRRWLRAHMPQLEALFLYRSIDVSSVTELAKRWASAIYAARPKAGRAHRALADVRESIAYLRYYRETGFIRMAP